MKMLGVFVVLLLFSTNGHACTKRHIKNSIVNPILKDLSVDSFQPFLGMLKSLDFYIDNCKNLADWASKEIFKNLNRKKESARNEQILKSIYTIINDLHYQKRSNLFWSFTDLGMKNLDEIMYLKNLEGFFKVVKALNNNPFTALSASQRIEFRYSLDEFNDNTDYAYHEKVSSLWIALNEDNTGYTARQNWKNWAIKKDREKQAEEASLQELEAQAQSELQAEKKSKPSPKPPKRVYRNDWIVKGKDSLYQPNTQQPYNARDYWNYNYSPWFDKSAHVKGKNGFIFRVGCNKFVAEYQLDLIVPEDEVFDVFGTDKDFDITLSAYSNGSVRETLISSAFKYQGRSSFFMKTSLSDEIIDAMKRGSKIRVSLKSTSGSGKVFSDEFSLFGATASFNSLDETCESIMDNGVYLSL